MSFIEEIARVHGHDLSYRTSQVLVPADPVLGRKAQYGPDKWVPFLGFASLPHQHGTLTGSPEVPLTLSNEITIHTEQELPAGTEVQFMQHVYRLTGRQAMPFGAGTIWAYPATMEVMGDGPD